MPNWDNFRYPPERRVSVADPYTGFQYEAGRDVNPIPNGAALAPSLPRSPENSVPLPEGTSGGGNFRYPGLGTPGFGYTPTGDVPRGFLATPEAPVPYINLSPMQAEEAAGAALAETPYSVGVGNEFKGGRGFKDAPGHPVDANTGGVPMLGVADALVKALPAFEAALIALLSQDFIRKLPFWGSSKKVSGIPGFAIDKTIPSCGGYAASQHPSDCGLGTFLNSSCANLGQAGCATASLALTAASVLIAQAQECCNGIPGHNLARKGPMYRRRTGYTGVPSKQGVSEAPISVPQSPVRPSVLPQVATPVSQPKDDEEVLPYRQRAYLSYGLVGVNPIEQTWRGPFPRPAAPWVFGNRVAAPPGALALYPVAGGVSVRPVPGVPPVVVPLPPLPVPSVAGNRTISIVSPRIFPQRPGARTKERKPKVPVAALHVLGHITESIESVQAVWFALPEACRSKPRPGRKTVEKQKMLWDLYQCFGRLDVETAIWNLVTETFMDFLYGKPSSMLRKRLTSQGLESFTPQRGSRMRPKADVREPKFGKAARSTWTGHHSVDEVRRAVGWH